VNERGHERDADGGNHRQQRAPPGVQHSARRGGLHDLLRHQAEEEHHGHVVDDEGSRVAEPEIAFRTGVGPDERNRRAQRQQQQVLEREQ
jgi:hypothetical protein